MTNYSEIAASIRQSLKTNLEPIGIAYADKAPAGVPHAAQGPASCSYWKRALDGETFFTDANDHLGCPVGAHTHAAPMTAEKQQELMGMVGTMVQLGYLSMSEVPGIPHRKTPLQVAVYSPLAKMPVDATLVLVRGTTAQLMLVTEAAQAAGVAPDMPAMGRPTCAVLPQSEQSGRPAVSLGCIGNRVYTGLGEGEGYVAIPASALDRVVEKLKTIAHANAELEKFHRSRASV